MLPAEHKARRYAQVGAVLSWLTLAAQLLLMLANMKYSLGTTIVQFFSYLTILSNLLVALAYTFQWKREGRGDFFRSPHTLTAIAVYILVVGAVYNIVLRPLWSPKGLQMVVDECLHTIIPLGYLLFWTLFVPTAGLSYVKALKWLWFPFIYCLYSLLRGAMTCIYLYPFLDVSKHGYIQVYKNCLMLCAVFFVLCFLFVFVGKVKSQSQKSKSKVKSLKSKA